MLKKFHDNTFNGVVLFRIDIFHSPSITDDGCWTSWWISITRIDMFLWQNKSLIFALLRSWTDPSFPLSLTHNCITVVNNQKLQFEKFQNIHNWSIIDFAPPIRYKYITKLRCAAPLNSVLTTRFLLRISNLTTHWVYSIRKFQFIFFRYSILKHDAGYRFLFSNCAQAGNIYQELSLPILFPSRLPLQLWRRRHLVYDFPHILTAKYTLLQLFGGPNTTLHGHRKTLQNSLKYKYPNTLHAAMYYNPQSTCKTCRKENFQRSTGNKDKI